MKLLYIGLCVTLLFTGCVFKINRDANGKKSHETIIDSNETQSIDDMQSKPQELQFEEKQTFNKEAIKESQEVQKQEYVNVKKYPDGTIYKGMLSGDMRHGEGKTIFPDGSFYIGGYFNDKEHGRGVFIRADGERIEGIFDNGKLIKQIN